MKVVIEELNYNAIYGDYTGIAWAYGTVQSIKFKFKAPDIYLTREPKIRDWQEGGIYADPFEINFDYFYEVDEDDNEIGTPSEEVKNAVIEALTEKLIEEEIKERY